MNNENTKNIKNIKKSIYMEKYNRENKDKLCENFICDICGGKYQKMNSSHHSKTKKHQDGLLIQQLRAEIKIKNNN